MMAAALYRNLLGALALAVAAAACGGGPTTGTGGDTMQQATGVRVTTTSSPVGTILTDASGRTLYLFTQDSQGGSTCYGACAEKWPPLIVSGEPKAGSQVDASLLGTTERKNGDKQVTYADMPLYYYAPDQASGDIKGQGVGGVWWVVAPSGEPIKKKAPAGGGDGSGDGGDSGGYGGY